MEASALHPTLRRKRYQPLLTKPHITKITDIVKILKPLNLTPEGDHIISIPNSARPDNDRMIENVCDPFCITEILILSLPYQL